MRSSNNLYYKYIKLAYNYVMCLYITYKYVILAYNFRRAHISVKNI